VANKFNTPKAAGIPDAPGPSGRAGGRCPRARSAAEVRQGFVAFAASIRRDTPLDWAVAVTFESEDLLHQWLDGATWKHLVCGAAPRGLLRLSSDLVIIEGAVMPTGVAIVSSSVSGGMEADFQAAYQADDGRLRILRL
jgi:uncharacterized protein